MRGGGRCGGPPRPCPRKESRGRPWVSERKGTPKSGRSWDAGGRGSSHPLQRCSSILGGVPCAPRGWPSKSRASPAYTVRPTLRRVSAGPLGGPASPPTARLPGPRPAAAPGQGAPPADADPACLIPVAPAEPHAAAAARIRAPAVEDRGSGVGGGRLCGRGAGAPGALDRGRRASRRAARAAGFM